MAHRHPATPIVAPQPLPLDKGDTSCRAATNPAIPTSRSGKRSILKRAMRNEECRTARPNGALGQPSISRIMAARKADKDGESRGTRHHHIREEGSEDGHRPTVLQPPALPQPRRL